MMKKIACFLFLLVCLPGLVLAKGTTTELRVTGTIKPDACVPNFSGGGVVDYGAITGSSLQRGTVTLLGKKTVKLSVNCALPTHLAIKLVDNRSSANAPRLIPVSSKQDNDTYRFGLGETAGKNTGGYIVSSESADAGAKDSAQFLEATSAGKLTHWASMNGNAMRKNTLYTLDTHNDGGPRSIESFETTLGIQAAIEAPGNPSASDAVPLNGSATFEMFYP